MCSLTEDDLEDVKAPIGCSGSACQGNGCHAGTENGAILQRAFDTDDHEPAQNGHASAEPARAAQTVCSKCKERPADVRTTPADIHCGNGESMLRSTCRTAGSLCDVHVSLSPAVYAVYEAVAHHV